MPAGIVLLLFGACGERQSPLTFLTPFSGFVVSANKPAIARKPFFKHSALRSPHERARARSVAE